MPRGRGGSPRRPASSGRARRPVVPPPAGEEAPPASAAEDGEAGGGPPGAEPAPAKQHEYAMQNMIDIKAYMCCSTYTYVCCSTYTCTCHLVFPTLPCAHNKTVRHSPSYVLQHISAHIIILLLGAAAPPILMGAHCSHRASPLAPSIRLEAPIEGATRPLAHDPHM